MIEERIIKSFEDLECWKAAREVRLFVAKTILPILPKEERYRLGDQMLRAGRSTTANIAEGYGRFHYLDKVKFYYNSRASHYEAFSHWLELMSEREKISNDEFVAISQIASKLQVKLNNFISATSKNARKNA
jgi:four helix bundle protein